jgi:hypothetical protein
LHDRPVLVALTLRDVEPCAPRVRVMLADLHREADVERLTLGGIDATAAADLARAHGRDATEGERLGARAGWNPFFLCELLRAPDAAVPPAVREAVARRSAELGRAAREPLRAAAVAGVEFNLDCVGRALGTSPERLLLTVERLIGAGLVDELPAQVDAFAFRHAVVRDAILEGTCASRRVRLAPAPALAQVG